MKNSELEMQLRAASLRNNEIAPLSPERSAAILAHALATTRKPNGGHRRPLYLLPGLRPIAIAAFTAIGAFAIFQRTETPAITPTIVKGPSVPIESQIGSSSVPPIVTVPTPAPRYVTPRNESQVNAPVTTVAAKTRSIQRGVRRPLPPATVTPIHPGKLWANTAPQLHLPQETPTPETMAEKPAKMPASDGPLLVAATGVPDDDSGELRVTVKENVPKSVPGNAEAAGIRMYADTPYQASPTDYWAHACIGSNTEPTLTLTALR